MASFRTTRLSLTRLRYLFLVAVILGASFVMMTLNRWPEYLTLRYEEPRPEQVFYLESDNRFTIKTNGCTIPALHPLNDNINRFIEPPRHPGICRNMSFPLLNNNATHIWINNSNLHHYNLSNESIVLCCYKAFYRPNAIADITADVDNRVQYHKCVEFFNVIEARDEFVRVSCRNYADEKYIYDDFFLFAMTKPLNLNNEDIRQTAYNVVILGIDSVSRLNFYRTMPKTLDFLKKKRAIELFGYNKIGDNTFPNLMAMLLGVKDTELRRMCFPSPNRTIDNCPFLWDWYKENGFYTALGEDTSILGTFNYLMRGFAATPTDYYLHTFINEAEMQVGYQKDKINFMCMGNKFAFKVLLDYVESLTETLRSSKLFGFFWEVTMTHDYLNVPKAMDDSYEKLLMKLDESNYLDNTILILLSDHGLRWGKFRSTKQGRLEERLPFVHFLLPPSFQQNYSSAYHNLKRNTRSLTTPFDIYATLSDLASQESISDFKISARTKQNYADHRSLSLFLPIPRNRTCKIAGIDDHWCTCHKDRPLPAKSEEAMQAAQFVVAHLNEVLKYHQQCARLSLAEVMDVREVEVGTPDSGEEGWREVLVTLRATPGGGVFEATLRRSAPAGTSVRVDRSKVTAPSYGGWQLAGFVSRLNLYGNQSRCVGNSFLKLYCVCHEITGWRNI